MHHKIRCDEKSWKLFDFQGELHKAYVEKLWATRRLPELVTKQAHGGAWVSIAWPAGTTRRNN